MKRHYKSLAILLLIPLLLFFISHGNYLTISFVIAFLSLAALIYRYDRRVELRSMVILSVLIAFSVAGRFAFAMIPGFKPIMAITMIAGIYMGAEDGFLTGALSMLISNFYFGQGPWTPFQMAAAGVIGYLCGLRPVADKLKKNKVILMLVSGIAGVAYSLMMDIWTTLAFAGTFRWDVYVAKVATSFPFMAMYVVSNIVFMFLLQKPIGERILRIKYKYGLTGSREDE